MSFPTSADIRAIWDEQVWSSPEIKAYTEKIHSTDVFGNQTEVQDLHRATFCGKINFIQYFAQRYRSDDEIGGCSRFIYTVSIDYYREESDKEQTFNVIQDFFDTLDNEVFANLGSNWCGLVSVANPEQRFPTIFRAGQIDSRDVIGGNFAYTAERRGVTP